LQLLFDRSKNETNRLLRVSGFDGFLSPRDHRTFIKPGGFKSGIWRPLPGPM
jgi:hypothetical protein